MKALLLALLLVGCTTPLKQYPETTVSAEHLVYDYPIVYQQVWTAADEFCERHTEAAKTQPEYQVDICVIECINDPTKSWCVDVKDIND